MRKMPILLLTVCWAALALAQTMAPPLATAGNAVTIQVPEDGTLYVIGPTARLSRKVSAGPVQLKPQEVRDAGRYLLLLKSGSGVKAESMYVTAATAEKLSFLAQPSRVPAGVPDVISGTAFVFDEYHNLVLKPQVVKFDLSIANGPGLTRTAMSKDGVAWTRMTSGKKEGAAQFVASIGSTEVKRVVQQVAAEPCNLRMMLEPEKDLPTGTQRPGQKHGILVRTDPIRDCAGNAVPDGTIVTFTQVDRSGISTVDARIKRDVATAELPVPSGTATISVASGVVAGNEITVQGEARIERTHASAERSRRGGAL